MARIDKFLRGKSFPDGRLKGAEHNLKTPRLGTAEKGGLSKPDQSLARTSAYQQLGMKKDVVISRNRSAGWGKEGATVLRGLNFDIQPAALTVIIGPVGSGKSTILNAILGEIPDYDGYMWTSGEQLAYCGQNPWLVNKTLKDNILGESMLDIPWYNTVIRACALDTDLKILPNGDQTMLGSGGGTLSGGQKQRVVCEHLLIFKFTILISVKALARAVYSRNQTVILDDPLSGLDPVTEERVVKNLFANHGIFRQYSITVVMATNNRMLP